MSRTTRSILTSSLSRRDKSCKTRDYASGAGSRDIFPEIVLLNLRSLANLSIRRYDRLPMRIQRTSLRRSQTKRTKRTIFLSTHSALRATDFEMGF